VQGISEPGCRLLEDPGYMALRARVGEEVSTAPSELGMTRTVERIVDPVSEELRPQVSDTSLAKQARMFGIAEQTPGDPWVRDQPPEPRHLPHGTNEPT
jgi:hypothetical protein